MLGRPYRLGEVDCFRVCFDWAREMGAEFPDSYAEIGISNGEYAGFFKASPVGTKALMIEFLEKHLEEVPVWSAFVGDIAVVRLKQRESAVFTGIIGGGGVLISATERKGVRALPRSAYLIERVFRCQRRSRS